MQLSQSQAQQDVSGRNNQQSPFHRGVAQSNSNPNQLSPRSSQTNISNVKVYIQSLKVSYENHPSQAKPKLFQLNRKALHFCQISNLINLKTDPHPPKNLFQISNQKALFYFIYSVCRKEFREPTSRTRNIKSRLRCIGKKLNRCDIIWRRKTRTTWPTSCQNCNT